MSKIFAILILTLTLTLVGCNRPQVDELQSESPNQESTQQVESVPTPPQAQVEPVTPKQFKALSEQQDQAIAELDPSKCDKLQDSNFVESCKIGIIFAEAQQKKDPSLCAKLESLTDKMSCEQLAQ